MRIIKTKVLQSEMFGYVATLRSISQGCASSAMEPSHYEEVPRNIAEEIQTKNAGKAMAKAKLPRPHSRRLLDWQKGRARKDAPFFRLTKVEWY